MSTDSDHPAASLREAPSRVAAWDAAVSRRIGVHAPHPRWFTLALSLLSLSGNYGFLWFVLAAVPWLRGAPRGAARFAYVAGAVLGTELLTYGVKVLVGRRRPPELERDTPRYIALPRSRSFPSSHASMGVVGTATLTALSPAWAAPLVVLLFVLAFSRVYLRVHYLLDVVAGLVFGACLAVLLLTLVPAPH